MELDELHVLDRSLGAVDHGDAVAGGDKRVGGGGVDGADAARGHDRHARQEGVHLLRGLVQDVCAVAGDVRRAARHNLAQVVLGDDFDGEVMLEDVDVGVVAHSLHEPALNLEAGVVGMVEDAELGVAALAVEVKAAVLVAVELHAPAEQVADAVGGALHHLLHGHRV